MRQRHWLAWSFLALLCAAVCPALCPTALVAQDGASRQAVPAPPEDTGRGRNAKARRSELPGFTPQREAAALSFVGEHHTELALLLSHLKGLKLNEYERAIRELFRSSERLAQLKERDEERYEIELEVWKLDSRIRLMAARLTMTPDDESLQEELRAAFLRKSDWQLQRLKLDRARLVARQERIEASITKLTESRERWADRSVKQLLTTVSKRKAGASKPKRPPRSLIEVKTPTAGGKPGRSQEK